MSHLNPTLAEEASYYHPDERYWQIPVAQTTEPAKKVRGRPFAKGFDERRHILTTADRQKAFWNAIQSVMRRYPNAVTSYHAHMATKLLPALIKKRAAR